MPLGGSQTLVPTLPAYARTRSYYACARMIHSAARHNGNFLVSGQKWANFYLENQREPQYETALT